MEKIRKEELEFVSMGVVILIFGFDIIKRVEMRVVDIDIYKGRVLKMLQDEKVRFKNMFCVLQFVQ